MWERRGRPLGLTGRQAHAWARLSPRERQRYAAFGRRRGLAWYEVYREPLFVTAARRHPSPLSHPWRYTWGTLARRSEELRRVARTPTGLAIAQAQRPPVVYDETGLEAGTLGRYWLFLSSPDDAPWLAGDGPWHHSLTFRDEPPNRDVETWVAETGIDWTVLVYIVTRGAFIWGMSWPETSPSGGERHNGKDRT